MKFKVHFTLCGFLEDYIVIKGESLEDVRYKAHEEIKKRNLDLNKNNVWYDRI
jgi:hypothetical protein